MRMYGWSLRKVEDWNESPEFGYLLKDVPPSYWKKKVEDEGTKRATQVKKRSVVKILC